MIVIDPVFHHIGVAASAIVFLLSAQAKLRRPAAFRAAFAAYRVVPARLAAAVAPLIPLLEAAGAAGLLFDATRAAAAAGLAVLLALFAAALLFNLLRGNDEIACGCGGFAGDLDEDGATARRIGYGHVGRVIALGVLLLPAFAPRAERPLFALDYATVGAAVLFSVTAYRVADFLLAHAPTLKKLGI